MLKLKIAFIHDWLLGVGGAEKVLRTFHQIFPAAPVYLLLYNEKFTKEFLPEAEIRTSFLQRFFKIFRSHKILAPFLPLAVESLDLSEYDLVISTGAFSKGLILKPKTIHVHYCSSPTRQFWDWFIEYRKESRIPKSILAFLQHSLRIWDRHTSMRVDYFIANSENVKKRIKKYYNRDSVVIYPPVTQSTVYGLPMVLENYFLIVSRLFKHKNIEIAVKAFNKMGWPLVVIGEGPELKKIKKIAHTNVIFLGFQSDEIVQNYYANCLAFIMPQEEDFGLTPIEAMGHGKPTLALKRGGALEYIEEGVNGEYFDDPTEEVLADGLRRINEGIKNKKYNSDKIKETAARFQENKFKKEIIAFLETLKSSQESLVPTKGEMLLLEPHRQPMLPVAQLVAEKP